jgi:cobalt/nickel transport system permease protein
MHISEGVLSPAVLASGAALAVAGTAIGLRRLDYDRLMTVAILASVFFVGSLIHVPIGVTSVHLILNGLLGVLLGWAAFPAILAALALQALFFQYGGLTILGVNTFTMAFSGVLAGYCCKGLVSLWPNRTGFRTAAFCGGALGVALAGIFTALALAFTDEGFTTAAQLLLLAHVPVMLAEGLITMFTVCFIARVRPEMLSMGMLRPPPKLLTAALLSIAFFSALLTPSDALAHHVNIFAWLDGAEVAVDCNFGKKSPVMNGRITVYDAASGEELLRGTTDDRGHFRFLPPEAARSHGLRVRVNAGEGHQNEWSMGSGEFSGAPAARPATPPDAGPTARDVVGGLGWLIGLAGICCYIQARRERKRYAKA